MGCSESNAAPPTQPLPNNTPEPGKDNKQVKEDPRASKIVNPSNPINKNKDEAKKLTTSTTSLTQSKSPSKNDNNLRTSTNGITIPKLQKNSQTSPSKVKLDIQKSIR